MFKLFIISIICISGLSAVIYDCYSGKPATRRQIRVYRERNNTQYCLINVRPCNEAEWRRVDGSCNNLKYPSRGMVRNPNLRVLDLNFSTEYEPRKTKTGKDLPLARYLRTQLLKEGKSTDLSMTQLASYYVVFALNDLITIIDLQNYAFNTTNCCEPEGQSNYICTPNFMPVDDPVHRYSGLRCQNLTRPLSFQYFGCADFGTTPYARINFATPVFDLGGVYGNEIGAIDLFRTFEKGLLRIEIDNGKEFPPSRTDPDYLKITCVDNVLPLETRCHRYHMNEILAGNLLLIQFYRHHNYLAKKLAELNPCWTDHRLFYTARDMNIASHLQIYYYELLPVLLGKKNLIRDGIISCSKGFRDLYDENVIPEVSEEFIYVKRWFHIIQDADLKLYDTDGNFLKTFPLVNLTARTGYFPVENNMEELFQGSFRQLSGAPDKSIEHDMGQRMFGNVQYASDGTMNDLAKGRFFGFQPYIRYREYCAKKTYKTFNSLKDVLTLERIHRLSEVYENVEDIELMAALWVENLLPGTRVSYTTYCLMAEHLKRTITSDRHWYERPNRPHAFTWDQLQAIRNFTIAGFMCATADGVTKIQPKAFYKISAENPLTDCTSPDIGSMNFTPWLDTTC